MGVLPKSSLGGTALLAARIGWVLHVAERFSSPDAWLPGHAVWHLLTALSLASIYSYYRLEAL
jgi:hypothetical protein